MTLKTGIEAKKSLIIGANIVADAVKVTMGAEGKLAIIRNKMGFAPHVTKDGVTVAEAIELEDDFEELGAKAIKETARKTVDLVGDGTTTATVIAQYLLNMGFEKLEQEISHVELREGMEIAVNDVRDALKKLKKNAGYEETKQIATISANNDEKLGQLIADVYAKIGVDGKVDVQEGATRDTNVSYVEGLSIDRGWSLPHFITDQSNMTAVLEDAYVLIFDGKIGSVADIAEPIRKAQSEGKAIMIFAEDVDEAVMAVLVRGKLEGTFNLCVTMNPDFGLNRGNILQDLAIFTSGEVYSTKYPTPIKMGMAKKVICEKERTVILPAIPGELLEARIELIKSQITNTEDKIDRSKLEGRLQNLKNAVAIITVGGVTASEVKEKKDRIDDAVSAVKSAIEGGYVSGGGSTLLYISKYKMKRKLRNGQKEGYNLVKQAIRKPFEQILANAGLKTENFEPKLKQYGRGVNVKTRKIQNLLDKGIIDSAKVLEVALENANAVASIVLQTDCVITNTGL
jgi:chaperonin GroEL